MNAIVCELCGSNDIVKKDGVFVCQHCGTKYSADEAKKLMVEVDNSKKLANLYERARKSIEVDDLEHAAEYYKQILDENPNDWEAYFYSYLGEFASFTNAQAASVASKLASTIPPAYDMACAEGSADEISERFNTISSKTAVRLASIASTGAALLQEYEGGALFGPTGKVTRDLYQGIRPTAASTISHSVAAFAPLIEKIESIYKDNKISDEVRKKNVLDLLRVEFSIANMSFSDFEGHTEKMIKDEYIQECAKRIKELDPDFKIPEQQQSSSSSGCYVATAVYGSYDCPQVWTLRRYRDNTLAETWYGRAFIRTYYAISPTLVKWFGETEWFKNLWKPKLDRMVKRLNSSGVADTPYNDKTW